MTPTTLAPVGLPAAPTTTASQADAPLSANFMALLLLLLGAGAGLPQSDGEGAQGSAVPDREPTAERGPSTAELAVPAAPAVVLSAPALVQVASAATSAAPAPPAGAAAGRADVVATASVSPDPRPALSMVPELAPRAPSRARPEPAAANDPGLIRPRDDAARMPAASAGPPSLPVAPPDAVDLPVGSATPALPAPEPGALHLTVRETPVAVAGAPAPARPGAEEQVPGGDDEAAVGPGPGTAGRDRLTSPAGPLTRPAAAAPDVPAPRQQALGRHGQTPDVATTATAVITGDGTPAPAGPARTAGAAHTPAPPPPAVDPAAVAGQVVRAAQLVVTEGLAQLRVDLEPPELGAVRISADARGDAVTLTIVAERPETQALLVQALPDMQRALGDRGLGTASVAILTTPDFGEGRRAPGRRQAEPRGQSTPHPDDRRRAAPRVPRGVSAVDITV